ncbi:MAG: helix-turn-helix domain-containing protein [Alphaproteobacteria bacterium]
MAGKRRKHGQGAHPRGDPADGGDAPARTGGAGATMRDERLRNGWELGELAAHLKIRRVHLAAIEDDRFDLLPAGSYAANFVRAYATALGLDPDEMVRRYRAQSGQAEPRLELNFPVPLQESRMPGRIVVLVSVLLAALAYGAWTQFGEHRVLLPRVDPVPEQLQAAAPPLPPPAPPPPAAPAAAEATAAVAVPVQATPPEATPTPAPTPAPAVPAPELPPQGRQYGEPGPAARVVILAQSECWVLVRDAAGNRLFDRVLKAGESYHAPNRPGLLLTTGSAGSIDVAIDGRPGPALGRVGVVRRDIPRDPDRLAALPPPPEAPRPAAPMPPARGG